MEIPEPRLGTWSSTRAFVWVAVGACVGMGNFLRFPELMATHGGARFLLAYTIGLVLIGVPLLMAEWSLGRWMRGDLVAGFRRLAQAAGARTAWRWLGALMVMTAGLILSYYSVIAGWSLGYVFRMAAGGLAGASEQDLAIRFLALASEPERGLAWHTIFMVTCCIVVAHGFKEGIEHTARRLIPFALLLVALLAAQAYWSAPPTVLERWLLTPAEAPSLWELALAALLEAFLTLSLGVGAMMALGVYLPAQTRLLPVALAVVTVDGFFALATAAALYLVMWEQPPITPSLALLFRDLPQALAPSLGGTLMGLGFYLLLAIMTLTSAVVLLEVVTRFAMERWRLTRVFAATSSAMVIWALGVLSLLSFAQDPVIRLEQWTVFELIRFFTAQLAAPLVGLLLCVFAARILPPALARSVYGEGAGFPYWRLCLRFPARIALIVLLLYGMGFFEAVARLF